MVSEKNKKLIERINEEFFREDNKFYVDYMAENIRWNIVGKTTIIGKDKFLEEMKVRELEDVPVIKIKNIIAEGEYVVVESEGKAKTKTGKTCESSYCDIYRIQDGKIQEMTTYLVIKKKEE